MMDKPETKGTTSGFDGAADNVHCTQQDFKNSWQSAQIKRLVIGLIVKQLKTNRPAQDY